MQTPTILHRDTCVDWKLNQTHPSTPCTHKHTLTNTCKTAENTCGSAFSHQIKTAFFVQNPLVVARPRVVTAHQSSVGGESADYLLHVTACVCSFRETLGPGQASQTAPTPPPFTTTHSTKESSSRSDLMLPSCLARRHTCRHLTCMRPHTDFFFLSFTILPLLTFYIRHIFPQSSFNQMSSPKQNFTVVLKM